MVSKVQGTTLIKVVRVAPPNLAPQGSWLDNSTALHLEKCNVSFAAVCPRDALGPLLLSRQASDAVLSAVEAFGQAQANPDMPLGLLMDGTHIADRMALLHFDGNTCALLLVASAAIGELVMLPPEGLEAPAPASVPPAAPQIEVPAGSAAASAAATAAPRAPVAPAGPFATKDASAELGAIIGLTESELALAAQRAIAHAADVARQRTAADPATGEASPPTGGPPAARGSLGGNVIWLVWAEAHLERISPSLLLGYALLASRRESALFLRMATGFGFAQMGDYNASSFYRFAKRGHRFKCWECGVKKKAPCGEVDRADLPWCCHRRLGAYLPLLSASRAAAAGPNAITIQSKSVCFVPLLPPKDAQTDPTDPLGLQLAHIPPPASVVALAELLAHKPSHAIECIGTALARLAPTCRSLWDTPWICEKLAQVASGDEDAATGVHRWLEKTAFFKMPRSQEAELVAEMKQPFEDLVGEVVPDVEGAPCLGGHNRTGADGTAPAPAPTVKMVDPELGISADAVRRKRMVNTGQGRRRLNARAALRTVAIAGRVGERSASPGQLEAQGADVAAPTSTAAGAAPADGQPEVLPDGQPAAGAPARASKPLARPPGRGRGRGRGSGAGRGRPKSRKAGSDSEDEGRGRGRGFSDHDEDDLDEAMQGLEALQHASPAKKRHQRRTRRSLSPPHNAEGKSPVSSPDFAKMRPPRKLRSGPKGSAKGSEAEPTPEGDDGGDVRMEEGPPSPTGQSALANRRSPRVAGMHPASDGIDSARPAKRQRRNSAEGAEPADQDAPVKRSPGRPRKHPLPKPEAADSPHDTATEADLAASQDTFAADAQRSGSAGGGQPARSGGAGAAASGPGRPPRQPTPGGVSMRAGPGGPPMRPGPIAPGPGMRARPAVPLLVLAPEQLQRADTGALSLPAQISNLLSAGSIQVLISSTLPARTINDRASLETLSRFLAGAPPYRPPQGGPSPGPQPPPPAAGRAPQPPSSAQQMAAGTPRNAPPPGLLQPVSAGVPEPLPNGQAAARPAGPAPAARPSLPELFQGASVAPDAAATVMLSQQQPSKQMQLLQPSNSGQRAAKAPPPATAAQPALVDTSVFLPHNGGAAAWQPLDLHEIHAS